ncbi:MAG TPA: hypothetical protein VHR15_18150 [Ktedonobacterales bacterium]|jgi:hypothetical protein|nr:hypothetical protein [Ktedonobacterales bacterium]
MEPLHDMAQVACNVASIAAIPWEELPDSPARGLLLEMAYAGLRVSAYCANQVCWRVRIEGQEMTCAEWAGKFAV